MKNKNNHRRNRELHRKASLTRRFWRSASRSRCLNRPRARRRRPCGILKLSPRKRNPIPLALAFLPVHPKCRSTYKLPERADQIPLSRSVGRSKPLSEQPRAARTKPDITPKRNENRFGPDMRTRLTPRSTSSFLAQ